MSEFTVRTDSADVEQIMRQIRARIREKRGVDYTEDEIKELATVKLETFLDPRGVRSDLLEQYRRRREAATGARNFAFGEETIYASSRPFLRFIRRLLNPMLKLFFNPNPAIEALHIQSQLNDSYNQAESLYYELIHNLVLETTRLGIEVKNLKMRVESMSSRLDFDERRARALEGVVMYRPGAVPPLQPPGNGQTVDADAAERRSRRRRRRGRRRPGGPEGDERLMSTPGGREGAAGERPSEPAAPAREDHAPAGPREPQSGPSGGHEPHDS
jgi:hypothetical protein